MKKALIVILSLLIGLAMGIFFIAYNDKSEIKTETIGHVLEVGSNCNECD